MSKLLCNKKALRKYLLDKAIEKRHHRFTGVKASVYPVADAVLRKWADGLIERHPSRGRRIEPE